MSTEARTHEEMCSVIECMQPYSASTPLLKSSYASTAPLPNAATSSKSSKGVDNLLLLNFARNSDVSFPQYMVRDLIHNPSLADDHESVKDGLASWLRNKRHHLSSDVLIQTERGLGVMSPDHSELWIRRTKMVDLVLVYGSLIIVQFEIESNHDRMATIQKLVYGLADQLRYLNNHIDSTVRSNTGFYVPVSSGYIEKVTCTWCDDLLQFVIKTIAIEQQSVFSTIQNVLSIQLNLPPPHASVNRDLLLPMSREFVENEWGRDSYQVRSGYSIVIISPRDNCVYKSVLKPHAILALVGLSQITTDVQQVCFPSRDLKFVHGKLYFKFVLFLRPFTVEEAKSAVIPLMKSVVNAMNELHSAGFAHQDIRLENICFHPTTKVAVLIDLDRSCNCSQLAEVNGSIYGYSTMYSYEDNWTAEMVDWRQLSIMINYILGGSLEDYHSIRVVASLSPYLTTMFNEGRHDDTLVAAWEASLLRNH